MNKLLILPIIAALVTVMSFSIPDAKALTIVDSPTCILAGGVFVAPTCTAATITLGAPETLEVGPGITLDVTTLTNGGTLIVDATGKITSAGAITNLPTGPGITNDGTIASTGSFTSSGTMTNSLTGVITSTAVFTNSLAISNAGLIHILSGVFTNSGPIVNSGSIVIECGVTYTDSGSITINPSKFNSCASIPEFPFSFSMIIMFVAVAAVYMGIRTKMIPGFKKF